MRAPCFYSKLNILTMQPLNLELLKKLPMTELNLLSTIIETMQPVFQEEQRLDVYENNCDIIQEATAWKMAEYCNDLPPFDFRQWLVENGWESLGLKEPFKKRCGSDIVLINVNDKTIYAWRYDNIETREILNEPIIPSTREEAEILFKLFKLL
jgi:hypothetical protein